MDEPIIFIITSVVIGILVALPAAMVELWLIKLGVVRNNMLSLILGILFLVFIKQIWYRELSWGCIAPIIMFFGIFGLNRGEFLVTMSKGRWWWKDGEKTDEPI
jgi:hypothetical protein